MTTSIQEASNKCLGQETCKDCPRYMDDCDGKEQELQKVKIAQVTQFFDTKGMRWEDFIELQNVPILPSEDKKTCLWTETPKIKEVTDDEEPRCGTVWYKEGKDGELEIYKHNYDTSD